MSELTDLADDLEEITTDDLDDVDGDELVHAKYNYTADEWVIATRGTVDYVMSGPTEIVHFEDGSQEQFPGFGSLDDDEALYKVV